MTSTPVTPVRRDVPAWRLALAVARLEMTSYTRSVGGMLFALLAPTAMLLVAVLLWYPAEHRSTAVPDMTLVAIFSVGFFSVGVALTEQRKNGVLKTYLASPISAATYLAGQILDRVTVVVTGCAVMVGVAAGFFHLRAQGSLVLYGLGVCLVLASMLALGFLLASRFASVEAAGGACAMALGAAMLAAGLFVDPRRLPEALRTALDFLPFAPMADILRGTWLGINPAELLRPTAVLAAWTVILVLAAVRLFRWTPDDR